MTAARTRPDLSPRARGARSRGPSTATELHAHRAPLVALIRAIEARVQSEASVVAPLSAEWLHPLLRAHTKAGRGFYSRGDLIAAYRAFARDESFVLGEARFVALLQMRPVRTQSGVAPVTVLTKPFPCPGRCVFCPNDVRMPKSYLSDEPGCQRAELNGFDPYLQTYQRLRAFDAIGHATDKAEILVLGGTFSFYPEAYQLWFITRCFEALNDFGRGLDRTKEAEAHRLSLEAQLARVDGRDLGVGYNKIVARFLERDADKDLLRSFERGSFEALSRAQRENETSGCRNVGLVLETRPDYVNEAEVLRLRKLGCTKVQLGYQSLSDEILAKNKRGHDLAATRRAMFLLRRAGFKVLAHFMPNLLGATPESDIEGFARIFGDPDFRPDELKVYPCSLIESAELMEHYERGDYRPYEHDELLRVLAHVLVHTPRYCRLSRVIRDISSGDIVVGNRASNFREIAEGAARASGARPVEIRSREVRGGDVPAERTLQVTRYESSVGDEVFIEHVTADDRILGFCRLSLPRDPRSAFIDELSQAALLREVHVYGAALSLGARSSRAAQHSGLGRELIAHAAQLACEAGFESLAVISAVGTREYYRQRGFRDGELYQHLAL